MRQTPPSVHSCLQVPTTRYAYCPCVCSCAKSKGCNGAQLAWSPLASFQFVPPFVNMGGSEGPWGLVAPGHLKPQVQPPAGSRRARVPLSSRCGDLTRGNDEHSQATAHSNEAHPRPGAMALWRVSNVASRSP